jgi:DNA-binding LacI/PurR family transcriptional regulator
MASIADVARLAGVPVSTVSHVIDRARRVTPQTAGLVLRSLVEHVAARGPRRSEPPTALVARNNLAMIGVMTAIRARGRRVPQNMSCGAPQ